jgi:inosine/xanthosine triphosphatase
MKINVGSQNVTKIQAVRDAVLLYPELFKDAEVTGVEIGIDIFGHPKTMYDTMHGAKTRAVAAFNHSACDYAVGLEGGLMKAPETMEGFVEVNACAIYDGKIVYPGYSQSFEWPPAVTQFILEGKGDASQAFKALGYTEHEKLGNVPGGIIGFLTRQKTTREQFVLESIKMAIIRLDWPEWYK